MTVVVPWLRLLKGSKHTALISEHTFESLVKRGIAWDSPPVPGIRLAFHSVGSLDVEVRLMHGYFPGSPFDRLGGILHPEVTKASSCALDLDEAVTLDGMYQPPIHHIAVNRKNVGERPITLSRMRSTMVYRGPVPDERRIVQDGKRDRTGSGRTAVTTLRHGMNLPGSPSQKSLGTAGWMTLPRTIRREVRPGRVSAGAAAAGTLAPCRRDASPLPGRSICG
jgi:hypothetical protein